METLALGMAFFENPLFKSPNHFQTSFCLEIKKTVLHLDFFGRNNKVIDLDWPNVNYLPPISYA